jgi:hypothetical protein
VAAKKEASRFAYETLVGEPEKAPARGKDGHLTLASMGKGGGGGARCWSCAAAYKNPSASASAMCWPRSIKPNAVVDVMLHSRAKQFVPSKCALATLQLSRRRLLLKRHRVLRERRRRHALDAAAGRERCRARRHGKVQQREEHLERRVLWQD